ncbi:neurexin-3-like [Anneissia japonica]|uniref:neurexin-3-like n=1 Tax=Anneissia japonica TaxID=1529436 RepID=UPI00142571F8|nr:neurexin-3-like [Anneissia japonica]
MVIVNDFLSKFLIFIFTASIVTALKYLAPEIGEESRTFARYQKWDASTTGALTLEFKTSEPSGLLVYLDDGGYQDYLALQLDKGCVVLSYKLAMFEVDLKLGENLNNSSWHTVTVFRNFSSFTFVVDNLKEKRVASGNDNILSTKTDLFVGGLPPTFMKEDLTAEGIFDKRRFVGKIRNIFYQNDTTNRWVTPKKLDSYGVEESGSDRCSTYNPCVNGGRCISFDRESVCNCSQTRYLGERCNEDVSTIMMSSEVETSPSKYEI